MPTPRYSFGLQGSANLLRAAADALDEVMEPFFDKPDWEYSPEYFQKIPALYQKQQPTALGNLEIFGIVVSFISTCFAKKIFDDIYDRTAKRPIVELLDKILGKVDMPPGKALEYRDIVYLEDIDLVVVVRALADKQATRGLRLQIMQAHRVAHSYIEQHGRRAPIHCHKITDGVVSLEPDLFDTLEEIKQHDKVELRALPRE